MCGQRLNNLVILNRRLWQQVVFDPQLSFVHLFIFQHFFILPFSQYLFSSYWILSCAFILYASPFYFPHPFQSNPPTTPILAFLLSFLSFPLAAWSLCRPFFWIRLFVPSLPFPGVPSTCLPVCEIREQAVGTSCWIMYERGYRLEFQLTLWSLIKQWARWTHHKWQLDSRAQWPEGLFSFRLPPSLSLKGKIPPSGFIVMLFVSRNTESVPSLCYSNIDV